MTRIVSAKGGSITPVWRRQENGELELVMPELGEEYRAFPRGARGRWELSGISDAFEMSSQFSEGPETKVRVEFTAVQLAGNIKATHTGKRFSDLFNLSTHPKSRLGELLGLLRGRPIELNEDVDIDAFIGATFVAAVSASQDGRYNRIAVETIEDGKTVLPPDFGEGDAGQPALVGAAVGGGDDVFGLDDEEL